MKKYSAVLLMAAAAILCMFVHYYFGWESFVKDAEAHNEVATKNDYVIQWIRDTFENLQSEFWQLAAQFLILAGGLRFMQVRAYEEDQEDIKASLNRIERGLSREANP